MLSNRGMDKQNVHTHTMGYSSAIGKNEVMLFAEKWMQLETVTKGTYQSQTDNGIVTLHRL